MDSTLCKPFSSVIELLAVMTAIFSWLGSVLTRARGPAQTSTQSPINPRPRRPTRPTLPVSSPDMSLVASERFGIDAETGFLPRTEPLRRLPEDFEVWERALQQAHAGLTYTGDDERLTEAGRIFSEQWRQSIREVSHPLIWSSAEETHAACRCRSFIPTGSKRT